MLSTKYLFEISDLNKNRLKLAGKIGAAGGVGLLLYNELKGNGSSNDDTNTPANRSMYDNRIPNPRGNRTAFGQKTNLTYSVDNLRNKLDGKKWGTKLGQKIEDTGKNIAQNIKSGKTWAYNKAQKLYGGDSKYD